MLTFLVISSSITLLKAFLTTHQTAHFTTHDQPTYLPRHPSDCNTAPLPAHSPTWLHQRTFLFLDHMQGHHSSLQHSNETCQSCFGPEFYHIRGDHLLHSLIVYSTFSPDHHSLVCCLKLQLRIATLGPTQQSAYFV